MGYSKSFAWYWFAGKRPTHQVTAERAWWAQTEEPKTDDNSKNDLRVV